MSRRIHFSLTPVLVVLALPLLAGVAWAQDSTATTPDGSEQPFPAAEQPAAEEPPYTAQDIEATEDDADALELEEDEKFSGPSAGGPAGKRGENEAAGLDAENRSCTDFRSQQEAQRYFEENGGTETRNVDGLDADGDGQACESLNAPVGGIDAGGGGTAPQPGQASGSGPLAFLLGGAALGLALGLLSLVGRRRRTAT